MSRFDRALSPVAVLVSILALALATGVGTAYAAGKVTSAQIKNGAVTTAKLKNGAVTGAKLGPGAVTGDKVADGSISAADLAPGTVPSVKVPPTYWAYVTQAGSVGRSSGGIASEAQLNGGFWQYRVTFPQDVSGCGYQVTSGDTAVLGSNEYPIPALIAVARSSQGPQVLAVNIFRYTDGVSIQDTFFIAVHC